MHEVKELLKKIKAKSIKEKIVICEKHWKVISLLITGLLTISYLFCKVLYFSYYKGINSIYHLEDRYIDMSDEAIIVTIVRYLFTILIMFASNCILYEIGTSKDTGKFKLKRKIKIILYLLFVTVIIIFTNFLDSDFSFLQSIHEILQSDWNQKIKFLSLSLYINLEINIYALAILIIKNVDIFKRIYKKIKKIFIRKRKYKDVQIRKLKVDNESDSKKTHRWILSCIISVIVMIFLQIILLYSYGKNYELQRKNYRLIIVPTKNNEKSEFKVDGKNVNIYFIIYEDKQQCIISKLENKNGQVVRRLDCNCGIFDGVKFFL